MVLLLLFLKSRLQWDKDVKLICFYRNNLRTSVPAHDCVTTGSNVSDHRKQYVPVISYYRYYYDRTEPFVASRQLHNNNNNIRRRYRINSDIILYAHNVPLSLPSVSRSPVVRFWIWARLLVPSVPSLISSLSDDIKKKKIPKCAVYNCYPKPSDRRGRCAGTAAARPRRRISISAECSCPYPLRTGQTETLTTELWRSISSDGKKYRSEVTHRTSHIYYY